MYQIHNLTKLDCNKTIAVHANLKYGFNEMATKKFQFKRNFITPFPKRIDWVDNRTY